MSEKRIPSVLPTWVQATERRQELLIISQPTHWISHWDVQMRRSRKCSGRDCYLCSIGAQKQLRVIVMAIDVNGREKLLELRERHRELLDGYESLVGARVSVKREGTAKNSPITVKLLEFAAAHERDISRLVDSFGLPAIVCDPTMIEQFETIPAKETPAATQWQEEQVEQVKHDSGESTSPVQRGNFGRLAERLV